jgi:hypothetical protein
LPGRRFSPAAALPADCPTCHRREERPGEPLRSEPFAACFAVSRSYARRLQWAYPPRAKAGARPLTPNLGFEPPEQFPDLFAALPIKKPANDAEFALRPRRFDTRE